MAERILNDLEADIKHDNRKATIISAGPSSRIGELKMLFHGTIISVNNATARCHYQWLVDPVDSIGGREIRCKNMARFANDLDESVFDKSVTVKGDTFNNSTCLYKNDTIRWNYPTDVKAVSIAIMSGARDIRLLGFDYGNPYGDSRNRIRKHLTESEAQQLNRFQTAPNLVESE